MDMTGLIVNLISDAVGGSRQAQPCRIRVSARWETPWRAWREVELWE
jgi:hypothetical protein